MTTESHSGPQSEASREDVQETEKEKEKEKE
jgi:hypothetical protein